ncbi:MAG: hypothetical protein RIC55_35310 [Pirellulaceae bacterium]
MPEAADFTDRYQPPDESPKGAERARVRPGGLTIVCVLAIVVGVFSLLGTLSSLATFAFIEQIEQFATSVQQPGFTGEMQEVQQKLQTEMNNVNKQYRVAAMIFLFGFLVLAFVLIFGGLKGLAMQSVGVRVLSKGMIAAIVLEVVWVVLTVLIMSGNFGIIDSLIADVESKDQMIAAFLGFQRFILLFSAIAAGLTSLAKLVYFLLSLRYLHKPTVRELFADRTRDYPADA